MAETGATSARVSTGLMRRDYRRNIRAWRASSRSTSRSPGKSSGERTAFGPRSSSNRSRGRFLFRRSTSTATASRDPRYHGGPDKAVYLYPVEHYAFWARELGRDDLTPGSFGENFTTEGLLETDVRIGDVFEVGSARIRVTKPRTPCAKLGMRMGSMAFVRRFADSGRTGFYLGVDREGIVGPGDSLNRVATDPSRPTVAEVFREMVSG